MISSIDIYHRIDQQHALSGGPFACEIGLIRPAIGQTALRGCVGGEGRDLHKIQAVLKADFVYKIRQGKAFLCVVFSLIISSIAVLQVS